MHKCSNHTNSSVKQPTYHRRCRLWGQGCRVVHGRTFRNFSQLAWNIYYREFSFRGIYIKVNLPLFLLFKECFIRSLFLINKWTKIIIWKNMLHYNIYENNPNYNPTHPSPPRPEQEHLLPKRITAENILLQMPTTTNWTRPHHCFSFQHSGQNLCEWYAECGECSFGGVENLGCDQSWCLAIAWDLGWAL